MTDANNKLLIWCGDSVTAGSGLSNRKQYRFSTLIQNELGISTINLAQSNTSIGHLAYKLSQILRIKRRFPDKELLVLFGLTTPQRLCIETDAGSRLTVSVNSFDMTAYKKWAVDIYSNRQCIKESCIAISWLASQCKKNNIKFKFYNIVCTFSDFEESPFVNYLNPDDWIVGTNWCTHGEIFDQDNLSMSKLFLLEKTSYGKSIISKYFTLCKHPNAAGHEKIAYRLIPFLKEIL